MGKLRYKLLKLKTIRLSFDIIFIAVALFLVTFLVINVILICQNQLIIAGNAAIYPNKEPIVLDVDTCSQINGVNLDFKSEFIKVKYKMLFSEKHSVIIFYHVLKILTLNLPLILFLFILFHLRNIINSVLKEFNQKKRLISHYIFNKKNIKRLHYIAYAFIIFPFIELSAYWADNLLLEQYFVLKGMKVRSIISLQILSWDYIIIGLIFITIIEVIRRGIALQEEQDLTI
ncbi:MAG: DUF2975 domain-containing protein [Bacteroidales bacterium]|jgi:hypothetical protein|nr:DUF2975 domain-containing protein [Bacteroidales bacterium]